MSINSNNNKETFKLLDVSTDSNSDVQIEIIPRKRRINRSRRGRGNSQYQNVKHESWSQKAIIIGITGSLLAWLAVLSWAAASLAADTRRLDASLREVSMGSQGVGDALQRCHSTAHELQHNHTEMAARLDKLILKTENLTAQVAALQLGLASVKQQVAGAPELVNVPQQLASLGTSVAGFGSQIKDFDATVAGFHAQSNALVQGQLLLNQNITQLKTLIDQMRNKSTTLEGFSSKKELEPLFKQQTDFQNVLLQISANVSSINDTLASKIDWATRDYKNDHSKVTQLLESVQNSSAALSSLQTAWRQSNDILSHNITDLTQKLSDKSAEVQREIFDIRNRIEQLQKTETQQLIDFNNAQASNSNTMPADVAKGKDDVEEDNLPKSVVQPLSSNSNVPKNVQERNSDSAYEAITMLPPKASVTGKPSILSAGSA